MPKQFDPLAQRYPSQRFPLYARGGMVNSSLTATAQRSSRLPTTGLWKHTPRLRTNCHSLCRPCVPCHAWRTYGGLQCQETAVTRRGSLEPRVVLECISS